MKKILSITLAAVMLLSVMLAAPVSAASVNDMFFDLAFGVTQSGHIEAKANNYYKFEVESYTTYSIDFDSVDQYNNHNGKLFVVSEKGYEDNEKGMEYKTYFSTETTRGKNNNVWYDGEMSLYAGTYYFVIVPCRRYYDDKKSSGYSNYSLAITPTVTKIAKITSTPYASKIKLNWRGDLGATGYQVQRKVGQSYKTIKTTTDTYCADTGLTSGTSYSYRVRGYVTCAGKRYYGEWSDYSATTKPSVPTIKTPTTNTKHKITANWNKVARATGYQVEISTKKSFNTITSSKTLAGQSRSSYTFNNLVKGKTYYVRVRSYRNHNDMNYYSSWSSVKKIVCK